MIPDYDYFGYETKSQNTPISFPEQHQTKQPGIESEMNPAPIYDNPEVKGSGKLEDCCALIPSSFTGEEVKSFGLSVPMKRAAQPFELAGAYVYLAGCDSSYVTGQVIHVNGGQMNGS